MLQLTRTTEQTQTNIIKQQNKHHSWQSCTRKCVRFRACIFVGKIARDNVYSVVWLCLFVFVLLFSSAVACAIGIKLSIWLSSDDAGQFNAWWHGSLQRGSMRKLVRARVNVTQRGACFKPVRVFMFHGIKSSSLYILCLYITCLHCCIVRLESEQYLARKNRDKFTAEI